MSLSHLIKQAAMEALEESSPVALMYGTVTRISPLEINIEQRFTIPAEAIFLTSAVINDPLRIGEKVLVLRKQGGQKYVVMDRLVKA